MINSDFQENISNEWLDKLAILLNEYHKGENKNLSLIALIYEQNYNKNLNNFLQSEFFYKKAIDFDSDDFSAYLGLARLNYSHKLKSSSIEAAEMFFKIAYEKGSLEAGFWLGVLASSSLLSKEENAKAEYYLKALAANNYCFSISLLGRFFIRKRNYFLGFYYLIKSFVFTNDICDQRFVRP